MLMTLSTTFQPATDLGYVLRKNPSNPEPKSFDLAFGRAHLVWPLADAAHVTVALLVDVDPVALVRGRKESPAGGPLAMYVNDRPYVASSFMSVALGRAFGSALNGRAKERPELVETPMPLEIRIEVVASRGGPGLIERLFEPLGYQVDAERLPRDETVPAWGESALYRLRLAGTTTVQRALQHLYVLLPVLDDDKHYWVGGAEVDKLVAKGEAWLAEHPAKDLIAERYLKHFKGLTRAALRRLEIDEEAAPDAEPDKEEALERPIRLNTLRMARVAELLAASGAKRVLDLGCGEGKLLRRLLKNPQFEEVVGVDVSSRALNVAERKLDRPRTPLDWAKRLRLLHGSLTYRDPRLDGFDAAALVEVVEHVDPERLDALARAIFGGARPRLVVVTTPNVEYNAHFGLPEGKLRHPDHRFEWTRAEFEAWAQGVADAHGYRVSFEAIGEVRSEAPELGAPTQVGVFEWKP